MSAMKLLQNRFNHLSEIKAHKSALDECRKNLTSLIDDAYYASHNADNIPNVQSVIIKIDSTASLMSEWLNSLADSDNDLAEQDSFLIKKGSPEYSS